jgi:dGTP triphosphohydrolase
MSSEKASALQKKAKTIGEISMNLKRRGIKDNIMREAKEIFYDKDFIEKVDANPKLVCFNNGVFDFEIKEFRKGKPDDYLSKSTKISYIKIDPVKKHKKQLNSHNKELALRQIIREIINEMVKDIIDNTKKNLKKENIKSIKDVRKSKKNLVKFSDSMKLFDITIKGFLKEKMYYSKEVLKKTNEGKKIIKELFIKINKKPDKFTDKEFLAKILIFDKSFSKNLKLKPNNLSCLKQLTYNL